MWTFVAFCEWKGVARLASLGVVGVDGLLERGDVAEGEQKEHHQLALVADGRHMHQQPQRRACTAPTHDT